MLSTIKSSPFLKVKGCPLLFFFSSIIFNVFNLVPFFFLYQHTSLPQQPKSYKLEKLKKFMKMLECAIAFLQVSKSNISLNYRLKLDSCEKQIIKIININRPNKIVPPLQYGQFPPPHMQSH